MIRLLLTFVFGGLTIAAVANGHIGLGTVLGAVTALCAVLGLNPRRRRS